MSLDCCKQTQYYHIILNDSPEFKQIENTFNNISIHRENNSVFLTGKLSELNRIALNLAINKINYKLEPRFILKK